MGADVLSELERLVGMLSRGRENGADPPVARGDAIDAVLAAGPRTTAVHSLRDAPEVEAFRDELVDGLIRADTANQLLRLVNEVISRLLV